MPVLLLIVGVMLVIVGLNNKLSELGDLIKEDFSPTTNTPSFAVWLLAIFAVGAVGYVKELKPLSNAFLVLVVLAMLLSNRGFFNKFTKAVKSV